jgi:Tol biopolymer transport system component
MKPTRHPYKMKAIFLRITIFTICLSVACRIAVDVSTKSDAHPILATQTAGPTPNTPTATAKEPTTEIPPEELSWVGKLVLVEYGDIYRVDVYCTQQIDQCVGESKNLTEAAAIYVDPSWSPSGHAIVFESDLEPASRDVLGVFIIREWGGEPRLIATTGHHPAWSPNGEEVAYATWEGDGQIMLVTPDGDVRKAVGMPDSSYPHWSPDGTRIAFTADGVGSENLYVLFLSDMTEGLVGHNNTGFMQWSPDGERIAFTAAIGDKIDLFISEVGDTPGSIGEAQLVTVDGSVSYPAWSPDGTAIAFVSRDQGNRNIYIASLDCFKQPMPCVDNIQLITNSLDTETSPIWFPDGNHLVYIAGSNASWRIEMVDLESGEIQVLVGGLLSPWQLDGYSK